MITTERLDDAALRLYREARALWLSGWTDEAKHGSQVLMRKTADDLYRHLRRDHGCEIYYEVELPPLAADGRETVRLVHPVGAVLGRATYAPGLVVYSGVNVGSSVDGEKPVFKGPCVLFPGAKVLGNVTVGANVWITAGTVVQSFSGIGGHVTLPANSIIFHSVWSHGDGEQPFGISYRSTKRSVMARFFPEIQSPSDEVSP